MSAPENHQEIIENFICEYPVCEYRFLEMSDLIFSPAVRYICEKECPRYNHSWACPPVIGTIEECMKRCEKYDHVFMFSTVADVPDAANMSACLQAKRDHEEVSYELQTRFRQEFGDALALTTGCMICDTCSYPDHPCRHPDKRLSTIESHGILIMQMAAMQEMNYDCGNQIVTFFTLILY